MRLTQDELKQQVAHAAVAHIRDQLHAEMILGIGTGSTVDIFIDQLATHKHRFKGAVSSSERTTERLHRQGIRVFDLNEVDSLEWYIDGADEINEKGEMTKGGGGALTREKIVASVAKQIYVLWMKQNK